MLDKAIKKASSKAAARLAASVAEKVAEIANEKETAGDANDTRPIEGVLTFGDVDPEGELLLAALEYQSLTERIGRLEAKKEKQKRLIRLMMGKDDFPTLPELRDDDTGAKLKWYPKENETIQDHLLLAQGVSPEIIRNATKRTETRYFRVFLPKAKADK